LWGRGGSFREGIRRQELGISVGEIFSDIFVIIQILKNIAIAIKIRQGVLGKKRTEQGRGV
jgi:hypothetical protein